MLLALALALALTALAVVAPGAAAEGWRWPVRADVVRGFDIGAARFAPGQHRGIDLAAGAGQPVRAACSGRVRFAGRVPRHGGAVTVDCGRLVATHLGLRDVGVRDGAPVVAGTRIGTAAGPVHLGARHDGDRFGYVDPRGLLGTAMAPPLGAAPRGGTRSGTPRRRPERVPASRVVPASPPAPAVPPVVWGGLALLLAGVPVGALSRRRRSVASHARWPSTSPRRSST